MKKINLSVAALLLAGSMLCSSCMVGSFSLFNKYREWQTNMTDIKIVNALVGYVLGSICYPISLFVDGLVLNTIEFWSGSNPVAANEGKTQTVKGQDGRYYAVKTLENGYEVKSPTGEITLFIHNDADDSWSMQQNGQVTELFRFNQDGTIDANLQNGKTLTVTQDQAGLDKVREAVMGDGNFFALR